MSSYSITRPQWVIYSLNDIRNRHGDVRRSVYIWIAPNVFKYAASGTRDIISNTRHYRIKHMVIVHGREVLYVVKLSFLTL